ncbi:hypothetical protein [Herbiconiux sp. L3-i23]|uniref:hypothetical protein n=1 Tax=Herbiconiux sp. L3-i23 TaxID=2905871 RepID=UPI0020681105|nr:hypothetical protein [Herbiconiux sp. L3-i23]BDI21462.1 hypothetical protein L3i23_02380 [Herbiconiux sp. L3-i23]
MIYRALTFTVQAWQAVDAAIDSSVSIDVVEGDVVSAMRGAVVRDAGWRASFHAHGQNFGSGWPPGEEELTLELSKEHWQYVADQLERWQRVSGSDVLDAVLDDVRTALSTRP